MVHNHPSGDPKPSAADLAITREIVAAANAVSVKVHDHLVIGRNGAESFKSLGCCNADRPPASSRHPC